MASKSTTNFRSYEAQARLLAAVIATAKPRLDYKEIQKLFGESTPAGLEFHFREVKAIGKAQQDAVSTGGDPTQVTVGTAAKGGKQGKAKTQRSAPSTPATSRKRQAPVNGAATTGGRGRKQVKREPSLDDDIKSDIDSPEENFDELDIQQTPSKFPSRAQRNPAYTVDNSTTNSDLDSPVFHQPYAVTQAENQARAQAMYKPDDFYGKPGDAQGNNGPTPHRSIFGGGDGATWSAGPSHPVAHTTEQSEDELMEIDGSQFSAARKTTNGPPKAATAKRAAATTPKQSKKAIKEDPFEDSTTNTGDFLDLTSTPSKRGGLPLPSSAYPSADQQDDWATSFDDQGDYYGDGEV